jgi:hypothetical protein
MTLQFIIVLALALLCGLYFLKDLLRSALGGGCGSGCASCKSGCPAKKLEAVGEELEKTRRNAV